MAKDIGYGSQLIVTTTTGDLVVAQVRSISGPGTDATDIDTTTLDSSSNFRTFAAGPIDPGEVTLDVIYDPADTGMNRLAEYHKNLSEKGFKVDHGSSTGDQDTFNAYVKSISREIPLDDVISASISLKVTGLPGYTT